jgi:SAM-dependent methyltransferase
MRLRQLERAVVRRLGGRSERDVETDFVKQHIPGFGLKVIDIGGVGSSLARDLAREGHAVTVCDVLPYPGKHQNLALAQGDFLKWDCGSAAFDVVVLLSTIEHVGFGHYGDPVVRDGDKLAMRKVRQVLKPRGRVILTTPFTGQTRVIEEFERWYDRQRLADLLDGFRLLVSEFWVPKLWFLGRCLRWAPASAEEAANTEALYHYHATACVVAEKPDGDEGWG